MDITAFIISGRNKALSYGDYATYHSQLSRRVLKCRQKLSITSKNRAKFSKRPDVTAQDVQRDIGYLHLLLLTSELAWAQAMAMKAAHAANTRGITGRNRSHIISRLVKACRTAELMASVISQPQESGATPTDVLEARAYASLLVGAANLERQAWEPSLRAYSIARVVYGALASSLKADVFKDLLSDTVDPSIRYAAYQLKTPRTVPVPVIAREKLRLADPELANLVGRLDSSIPKSGPSPAAQDVPRTLTWRSREVTIEDAEIAQAWNSVGNAKSRLGQTFSNISNANPRRLAAAYDGILTATQEAVDATKLAIDELREEGVPSSDPRMQALHVTRTAVNFEMISWRIGRNRVLTGAHDGALDDLNARHQAKLELPLREQGEQASPKSREEKPRQKLVRLKEKVALYDGTLQNLDAIKELAGVAADEQLSHSLVSVGSYFEALKCLAIGRSHAVIGQPANSLALLSHALTLTERMLPVPANTSAGGSEAEGPLSINVGTGPAEFLQSVLRGEQQRHCALVLIGKLAGSQQPHAYLRTKLRAPLSERLGEFPVGGVDLGRIVEHPPRLSSTPVKPIFLDVAWNHIEYAKPDRSTSQPKAASAVTGNTQKSTEQAPQRRGWFGFSR